MLKREERREEGGSNFENKRKARDFVRKRKLEKTKKRKERN